MLYIHDFKYNLLSVAKLSRDLNCCVMFYRNIVVFQNLSNGRVVQISKEPNGLYICGSKIVNAGALGATNDLIESKDI